MATARRCDVCDQPYIAQRATSKYCSSTCRAQASMGDKKRTAQPAPDGDSPLVESVTAYVAKIGAGSHPLGVTCIALATRIASNTDNGSALAALSKELRSVMAEAAMIPTGAVDAVDEMTARRNAKRANAG